MNALDRAMAERTAAIARLTNDTSAAVDALSSSAQRHWSAGRSLPTEIKDRLASILARDRSAGDSDGIPGNKWVRMLLGPLQEPSAHVRKFVTGRPAGCEAASKNDGWDLCVRGPPCTVFSIGVGGDWDFEERALRLGCVVHSYDPTIALRAKHQAAARAISAANGGRLHFHYMGLGSSIAYNGSYVNGAAPGLSEVRQLDALFKAHAPRHAAIDVLKIDCEGCEYEAFNHLVKSAPRLLCRVRQLSIELHVASSMQMRKADDLKRLLRHTWIDHRFRVFHATFNRGWGNDRGVLPELVRLGVPGVTRGRHKMRPGACCYMLQMWRAEPRDSKLCRR